MPDRPITTVFFDLDGTLIDHFQTIYRCYAEALHQMGLEPVTYEKVKATVGGGIRVTFSRLVPEQYLDRGVELWMESFDRLWQEGIEVLPGIEPLLARLKAEGIRTAIFTNKEGPTARKIKAHLGWDDLLETAFGRLDTPWAKPDARFTQHALDQLGVKAEETILIGDSPFDVEAAHNVGMRAYAVATGSHSVAQLEEETDAEGIYTDVIALARDLWGWELRESTPAVS